MDFHREKRKTIAGRWIALILALMFILPSSSMMGSASEDSLVVNGNASPSEAEPGQTISFTATAEFGNNVEGMTDVTSSTEFMWFFGDGSRGEVGHLVNHSYSSTGTYTVRVTGTYSPEEGIIYGSIDYFTVTIRCRPVAVISASSTEPRAYLDKVHFDASGSQDPGCTIVSYKWNFGDGSSATGKTADHIFKEGKYTVRLTVTDNDGFTDTATITIESKLPDYRITNTIDNSTHPKVYYYQNELRVFWIENGSSVMVSNSYDYGLTWSNASEIFSSPSLSITNIWMAYDENNLVLAVECAPSGEFPFLYILYSNDTGNTWFSPYALRGDKPSIDMVGSDIYLVYRRWSGLGTPDFYLTMVITYMCDGTVYSHTLANPSGSREFTGVPKISVIRSESVTHIYVTVADYVTKNVYFWESLNSGTAWSNPQVIAELTEVDGDYMDLKASPHALYFIWSDKRMGNYELWFKVYREGEWSEDLLLTNALGDSFEPVTQIDRDSFVHILWSDFRDCNYEIYETVLDYNGNTVKNDSRITTTSGNSGRPDMFIYSLDKTLLTSEYYTFDVWQDNSEGGYEIYFKNNILDGYIGQTTASLTSTVQTAQDYISALPDDYFSTPNLRKPLINKYDVVGRLLENGNYLAATNKIKYDITPKMDGFEGGNPRKDWIIADTAQNYLGGVNKILVLQPGGPPGEPIPPPSPPPPPSPSPPAPPSQPQPEISAVLAVPAETSISISWNVDWPNIIDHPTFVSSARLNGETISYPYPASSYYAEFDGLTADTTYTFTIYAAETSGGITYSSTYTSSAKTDAHVLQITFGPLVTATTNGGFSSALIEWGTNNPASSILEYRQSGTSGWTAITRDTGSDMTTSHHITISGLSPGTAYDYKVSSENPAYSEVPQATGSFSTPKSINDLAVSPTYDQAVFSWHTDISMDTEVYYKLSWETEWRSVTIWESVTEHTITITGLQPSTTYDYYVKSKNDPSSAIDLIVISSPSTFTTDAFFSRIEASDYYSIDENGNVIEGTMVSWTTTEPTINNLVKYTTDANADESTWNARPTDSGDSVRSHYVLIPFSASADYTYRVYSTVPPSETLAGPTLHFRALPDTDGDGLHDAEEDYGWIVKRDINGDGDTNDDIYYGGVLYYKETLLPWGEGGEIWSSWKNKDSDSDGLNDREEKEHYTDPQFGDTDHDGLVDSLDTMNPLTNLKISFNIKGILQLDPVDDGSGSDADKDNTSADFYLKIKMDGGGEITWKNTAIPIEKDNAHITSPQNLVFPVDDNIEEVTFTVYLYDDDSGTGELCDISPSANYYATLHYSLKNSTWWGDDFVSFSRYRHLNGTMDGSNISDENDCDILFRIDLSDVDGDGVTYWDEVNRYHTSPICGDTDNDGLKDGEEIFIYGINPNDPDIDDDGILDGNDWIAPTEWGYKDELILTFTAIGYPPETYPMLRKLIKYAISSGVRVRINVQNGGFGWCYQILTDDEGAYYLQTEIVNDRVVIENQTLSVHEWVRDYGPQFTVNSTSSEISIIDWNTTYSEQLSSHENPSILLDGDSNVGPGPVHNTSDEYPYYYFLAMNDTSRFRYVNATNITLDGGAFQTDGNGYGYVSKVLTDEERENLKRVMGLKEIRVLPVPPMLTSVPHLDMYTYIASSDTVILSSFPDSEEDNDTMNEIANSFRDWGFKILSIPTPSDPNIPYTYTDALVLNDVVFIPSYSNFSEYNQAAKNIFKEAFPDKTIVPINADEWILRNGAIHCLTITRPWVSSSNDGVMP